MGTRWGFFGPTMACGVGGRWNRPLLCFSGADVLLGLAYDCYCKTFYEWKICSIHWLWHSLKLWHYGSCSVAKVNKTQLLFLWIPFFLPIHAYINVLIYFKTNMRQRCWVILHTSYFTIINYNFKMRVVRSIRRTYMFKQLYYSQIIKMMTILMIILLYLLLERLLA